MKLEGGGLSLTLDIDGARAVAPRPFDTSGVPGLVPVVSGAWLREEARIELVCVSAPTRVWVPGLEQTLLDAASAKARAFAELTSLVVTSNTREGPVVHRGVSGESGERTALGRHVLGFVGPASDVVICTALCSAPKGAATSAGCETRLDSLRVEAAFVAAPTPGWLVRRATEAAEHPRVALGGVAAVALVACAVLLFRRPRAEEITLDSSRAPPREEELFE